MTQTLKYRRALLAEGWADNVVIEIDDDGKISAIECVDVSDASFEESAAVPGMANLHSHAHQRAMAGLAERSGPDHQNGGDSFWSWRKTMYQFIDQMRPDQLHHIANQLYVEMLKAGYTRVAEFQYLHRQANGKPYDNIAEMSEQIIESSRETGIALTCLPVLYQQSGFTGTQLNEQQLRFYNETDSFLLLLNKLEDSIAKLPNANLGFAAHSLRAVSKDALSEVLSAHRAEHDFPIHIHIAEQLKEVDDCVAWSGLRPVEYLYEHFSVDEKWCLIHATHLNDAEVNQIAQSKAVVGLCPTTEANLGDGFFPAREFLDAGGRIGIGSDSHISISVSEELRWLEYGQRLCNNSRNHLAGGDMHSTGRRLFDSALSGGAQACAAESTAIAVGQPADIVVLDTQHPLLCAREGDEIIDSWLFSGNQSVVTDVFVAGNKVIADGRHKNEAAIADNFNKTLREMRAM